jgi:tetratricopeptide (TPR) repeat protein
MNPPRPRRILLIGWSGADGKIVQPLIDRGEMPALDQLVAGGVFGEISTLSPLVTPSLWTSIATGKRPFHHDVHGYAEYDEAGNQLQFASGNSRPCKAVWEILSHRGLRCHVVGWPATHRVAEFSGACVSDAFAFLPTGIGRSVSPARFQQSLAEFRVTPNEIAADVMQLFVPRFAEIDQCRDRRLARLAAHLAECASIHAAATWLAGNEPWDFAAIFFPTLDRICREFIYYHPPTMKGVSTELSELYRDVVASAYRFQDLLLARMLEFVAPEDMVILVSEHGYLSGEERPDCMPDGQLRPATWRRPAGLLAMRGPGTRSDDLVFGGNVLHVTPTILTLFGLPVGEDMESSVLHDAFVQPLETSTISSWEGVVTTDSGRPAQRSDSEETQILISRFVELGQIQPAALQRPAVLAMERAWHLALSYLDGGRPNDALPLLEKVYASQPERIDLAEELARCQMQLGRLDDAEETMEAILDAAWDQPFTKLMLGNLAYARGDFATSLEYLSAAEHTDPHLSGIQNHVGLTLSRMGCWEQAERAFHRALEAQPLDPHAHLGLAHASFYQGRFSESAESALNAIALKYHLPFAHLTLGMALCRLREWHRAIVALENAIRLAPALPAPHRILAHLYRRIPEFKRSSTS